MWGRTGQGSFLRLRGLELRSCPCMYEGSPGRPGFISLGVASRSLCYQMLGKEVFTHPFPLPPSLSSRMEGCLAPPLQAAVV